MMMVDAAGTVYQYRQHAFDPVAESDAPPRGPYPAGSRLKFDFGESR